jgi:hypothetical protein
MRKMKASTTSGADGQEAGGLLTRASIILRLLEESSIRKVAYQRLIRWWMPYKKAVHVEAHDSQYDA